MMHIKFPPHLIACQVPVSLSVKGAGSRFHNIPTPQSFHRPLTVAVIIKGASSIVSNVVRLITLTPFHCSFHCSRALWMTGAALLGVVVLKLAVNDLGNTGTVARIVSFIGVGVLLMVTGYLAPVPPKVLRDK